MKLNLNLKSLLCRDLNPGLLAFRAWCANHYTTESELMRERVSVSIHFADILIYNFQRIPLLVQRTEHLCSMEKSPFLSSGGSYYLHKSLGLYSRHPAVLTILSQADCNFIYY